MNQILFTGDKNDRLQINRIVRVFCIIIIIFSIPLITKGIYGLVQENNNKSIESRIKPEVNVNAQGSTAVIKIKHDITINSVFYSWNNGEEMQISDINGKNEFETQVQLPNEDAIINIKIIDNNKNEFKAIKEFKYDEDIDIQKPNVELSTTPGSINIWATDNKEVSYITYKWDEDKETKIENNGKDKTKMETKLSVQEGKKKITVTCVDKSGNKSSNQKEIVIVSPPEVTLRRNKGELIIRVKDEQEVTKVIYEINGTKYTQDNNGNNKKEVEIRTLLSKGENIVRVIAYNKHGVTTEKIGKCTY